MSPRKPTIIVLGANGRLGSAATIAFAQAGWRVIAQVRRARVSTWPEGVEEVTTAVSAVHSWQQQLDHVDIVLHALNPLYTQWQQHVLPMAEQSMDLAQALDGRFMLPGNIYNYGESMPVELKTDTPFNPTSHKGKIRVELEERVQQRCESGHLHATVVRAGDFFGHGTGSWFDLVLAKNWRRGKLTYPGPLNAAHAWAYLPDLAATMVALAGRECRSIPTFEVVNFSGHCLTGHEFLQAIKEVASDATDTPQQHWKTGGMPWWLIRAVGTFIPMWRELAEMAYLWRFPHRLHASPWPEHWGVAPTTTPLHDALVRSLRMV